VTNKDRRAILRGKDTLGSLYVVCERERWVLDDADVVTLLLEDLVDAFPAGAIHKTTVHQNDILHCRHLLIILILDLSMSGTILVPTRSSPLLRHSSHRLPELAKLHTFGTHMLKSAYKTAILE
jgi:hypothetical protein